MILKRHETEPTYHGLLKHSPMPSLHAVCGHRDSGHPHITPRRWNALYAALYGSMGRCAGQCTGLPVVPEQRDCASSWACIMSGL